jgi:hypothetical protein
MLEKNQLCAFGYDTAKITGDAVRVKVNPAGCLN